MFPDKIQGAFGPSRRAYLLRACMLGYALLILPFLFPWPQAGLQQNPALLKASGLAAGLAMVSLLVSFLLSYSPGKPSVNGQVGVIVGLTLLSALTGGAVPRGSDSTALVLAAGLLLPLSFRWWGPAVPEESVLLRRAGRLLARSRPLQPPEEPDLALAVEDAGAPPGAERVPPGPGRLPDRDGAVLVETGTFRVDTARALEKLREFALFDQDAFLLPWLRCAVASGAREIEVDLTDEGLALFFDGEPLPESALRDPYACLFEEAPEDRARRVYLAHGLLGALRHKPRVVRLASGTKGARRVLRAGAAAAGDTRAPAATSLVTGIEVALGGFWPRWRARRYLRCLAPLFPVQSVSFRVRGRVVAEARVNFGDERGVMRRKGGFRLCRSSVLEEGRVRPGQWRLRLYKHGVLAGAYAAEGAGPGQALVNDDNFTLDISGGDVVRDEVWAAAVRAAGWPQAGALGPRLADDSFS